MDLIVLSLILALTVGMLASGVCRSDLAGLFVVCLLISTGIISEKEALTGFSNQAVITIACMFIIAQALKQSGVIDTAVSILSRFKFGDAGVLVMLLLLSATVSGFISNTFTILIFLPIILALDQRNQGSARAILLPVAFIIQIAGNLTLTGSSNNLLVNSLQQASGRPSFDFFEIAPLTLILCPCAFIIFIIARVFFNFPKKIPIKDSADMAEYLFEVLVPTGSALTEKPLSELKIHHQYDLFIAQVTRQDLSLQPTGNLIIHAGDTLLVRANQSAIMRAKALKLIELDIAKEFKQTVAGAVAPATLRAVIPAGSILHKHTLAELQFQQTFKSVVLAIRRGTEVFADKLSNIALHSGDELILLADPQFSQNKTIDQNLIIVKDAEIIIPNRKKALLGIIALILPVTLSSLNIVELSGACLLSVLLLLAFSVITSEEAYAAIDPKLLVFIACMFPLSVAIESTGLAAFLTNFTTEYFNIQSPAVLLLILMLMTSLLTELVTNAAASAIFVPLALEISQQMSISADPYLVGIIVAASTSFVFPFGDQFNMLAFYAGKYRWRDFLYLGIPLKIILLLVSWLFIPALWPF